MKKLIYILFIFIGGAQMFSCAPAPHVRTGLKMNVPIAWQGTYPYAPPDSAIHMGKPVSE